MTAGVETYCLSNLNFVLCYRQISIIYLTFLIPSLLDGLKALTGKGYEKGH